MLILVNSTLVKQSVLFVIVHANNSNSQILFRIYISINLEFILYQPNYLVIYFQNKYFFCSKSNNHLI